MDSYHYYKTVLDIRQFKSGHCKYCFQTKCIDYTENDRLWSFVCVEVFVCVEILRPSQPNGVMSSAVSLPNHTFTGQA